VEVFTDPCASPTGFPFKIVEPLDSSQNKRVRRSCDLGVLRQAYLKKDQTIGYRCPSEPINDYLRKEGNPQDLTGRRCVCNGLMATIGLGQSLGEAKTEPALVTAGDSLNDLIPFLKEHSLCYRAADVIQMLTQASESLTKTLTC
jgi:nitronate monooxygenase